MSSKEYLQKLKQQREVVTNNLNILRGMVIDFSNEVDIDLRALCPEGQKVKDLSAGQLIHLSSLLIKLSEKLL